uniref:Uncharacterized protein n=1 Tax=Setaria italica TaxID=4555 RepID=K3XUP9_SETIT
MLASIFDTQEYGYSTLQYRATVTCLVQLICLILSYARGNKASSFY